MHGEPTMHPDYISMVGLTRKLAPNFHIMMTSNGGGLLRKPGPVKNMEKLFEAGLDVLALDDYENANIIPKIRLAIDKERQQNLDYLPHVTFYSYPEQPQGNPHRRRKDKICTFIQDINIAQKGTHSLLNNHAGAGAPPLTEPMKARCAKPFRELSVRFDGNVSVCCNDWRGTYKCGNIPKDGLEKIWNGAAMNAARQMLILGDRNFGPCAKCDAKSYRVGLLPDKFGKIKLPKPDVKTKAAIKAALAGAPYTAPVLREWEQ
jgi:radical SAM protein with 4Fe4S-binding SPASM domain